MATSYTISTLTLLLLLHQAETSCPPNYSSYLCQCVRVITESMDFVSAQKNCSDQDGSLLLFTRTSYGWENLIKSGWNIPNRMWFGMIFDGDSGRYEFSDQTEYSFNSTSDFVPWADANKAQTPLGYYTDGSGYLCVQVRPNDAGFLALFITPCTDMASAVCLKGTLDPVTKSVSAFVGTLAVTSFLFRNI